nr:serine recombinase [bacterium]
MKAVIYKRVSTKLQVDKFSLPAQEKILSECIAREGQELVEIYCDKGISGEKIADRPAMQRLLNDADAGKFDVVWVIDQNRLSRGDLTELSYIKKIFKDNNIIIQTPSQTLDLSDVDDDFISNLYGIIAERERRKTKQSADRGRRAQFEKGEWGGRIPPYGYDYDSQKSKYLAVNEKEAGIYRLIVSLQEQGMGCKCIANELNKRGIKTRSGVLWRDSHINYILKNPVYKGELVRKKYVKTEKRGETGQPIWRKNREFLTAKGGHEPLISAPAWDQIQNRLAQNRNKDRLAYNLQLLTNLLECSVCGNTFKVGSTGTTGYRKWVYRCKTKYAWWFDKTKPDCAMRTFGLDEYNRKVWQKVQEVARKPEVIKRALARSSKPHVKNLALHREELAGINKELDGYAESKDRAVSFGVKGILSEEELQGQLLKLSEERESLVARKKDVQNRIAFLERTVAGNIDEDMILKYAKYMYQPDEKLNTLQKRRVLEAFVSRVPIQKDGSFEVIFKFPIISDPLTFNDLMKKIHVRSTIPQTAGSTSR